MTRITLRVPDEVLTLIDAEAGKNRTKFILDVIRQAIALRQRDRLDAEVTLHLLEDVVRDQEIARDFTSSMNDGFVRSAAASGRARSS